MKPVLPMLVCLSLCIACTKSHPNNPNPSTDTPVAKTYPVDKLTGTYKGRIMRISRSINPNSPTPEKIDTSYVNGSLIISSNKDTVIFKTDFAAYVANTQKAYADSNHYYMSTAASHSYEYAHIYTFPANDSVYLFDYSFAGSGGSQEYTYIFGGKR